MIPPVTSVGISGSPQLTGPVTLSPGLTAALAEAGSTITCKGEVPPHWFLVQAYGAVGDGSTDDTTAFQDALNAAGASSGGGNVYAPWTAAGYLLSGTLNIPPSVCLIGDMSGPISHPKNNVTINNANPVPGSCTTLLTTYSTGGAAGTPFITLNQQSGLMNLAIVHPNQPDNTSTPTAYPWTVWLSSGVDAYVVNVNFHNAYQAIGGQHHYRPRLEGLRGQALFRGLYLDDCEDCARCKGIHWILETCIPGSNLANWIAANGIAFDLPRLDEGIFEDCFAYGYLIGIQLRTTSLSQGGGPWIQWIGGGADVCGTALKITGLGTYSALFVGAHFTGSTLGIDLSALSAASAASPHFVGCALGGNTTNVNTAANGYFTGCDPAAINNLPASGGGGGDMLANLVNAVSSSTNPSATTLVANTWNVIKATSACNAKMPAPSAGAVIGIELTQDSTNLFTLNPHASENIRFGGNTSRIMWAQETAVFRSDGTDWFLLTGSCQPMQAAMHLGTNQTVATGVVTITLDTSDVDNTGLMVDTTNHRIAIQRAGKYLPAGMVRITNLSANGTAMASIIQKGGTSITQGIGGGLSSGDFGTPTPVTPASFAAGDLITLCSYQAIANETAYGSTLGNGPCQLSVTEIPPW
jgi:hypothetical protein